MAQFYLTSFKVNADKGLDQHPDNMAWSSAVYQPHWLPQLPKAEWMDIRPDGKNWIRPREFIDQDRPLDEYFQALAELYASRQAEVEEWIEGLTTYHNIICCWCPYDRAAKRQIERWGTFVCHTAAVGDFLQGLGYEVLADEDRKIMVRP